MAQTNLDEYPDLRIPEAPEADAGFIQSDDEPTGLGLPPLVDAVANTSYAATEERVRKITSVDEAKTFL